MKRIGCAEIVRGIRTNAANRMIVGHPPRRTPCRLTETAYKQIAATFFLILHLLGFLSLFRNRHRFFDQDPNVDNDIPVVRKLRIEVVMLPWLGLTTLLVILLIYLWRA